jgi:hypothetical protein
MKSLPTLLATALLLTATLSAHAEGKGPAGTWTWSTPGRNGGAARTNSLTLKVEGSKLTGKLASPGRDGKATETDITAGKADGDKISFTVVREFNGNSISSEYSGKVEGDTLTGKIETTREGQKQSRDWAAKR